MQTTRDACRQRKAGLPYTPPVSMSSSGGMSLVSGSVQAAGAAPSLSRKTSQVSLSQSSVPQSIKGVSDDLFEQIKKEKEEEVNRVLKEKGYAQEEIKRIQLTLKDIQQKAKQEQKDRAILEAQLKVFIFIFYLLLFQLIKQSK